jgi:3-deoxy-D-manno-octulosonic-acid transferase
MSNFREIAALVLTYQAGLQVETPQELTEACRELIINRPLRLEYGRNGLKMMTENGGATSRHMEIIANYL